MTSFNAFQHDGYGGFKATAFNARNGGAYVYVITTDSGTSSIYKVSRSTGATVASASISDFIAKTIAVSADGSRIAVGAWGGSGGDDTVKLFDSSLSEVWGVSLAAVNDSSGGSDIAFLSGGDVIFGTTKVGTLVDQDTLYRLDADDGSTTWGNRFPDNALPASTLNFNRASRLDVDASDNIYVHGTSNSPASTNNLAKFSSSGVVQWTQSKTYVGAGIAYSPTPYLFTAGATATSGERRVASTGASGSTGTVIGTDAWHHDGALALFLAGATARKYDESFTQAWSYALGATATGVQTDSAGNSYWSHFLNGSTKNLTKLDADGGLVWSVGVGGDDLEDVA